jgi:V-type H+-transporting ATPase subunit H
MIDSSESSPLGQQYLLPFLTHLAIFIQSTTATKREGSVQCLEALLARPESRRAVWAIPGLTVG